MEERKEPVAAPLAKSIASTTATPSATAVRIRSDRPRSRSIGRKIKRYSSAGEPISVARNLCDLSVAQMYGAVGERGSFCTMRCHQDRCLAFPADLLQQFKDGVAGGRVEIARRFVGKHEAGPATRARAIATRCI